ncbi:MAG TPA: tetratricopeptide repeat protein [Casimicrobiaceae bacterium]|nr:tetratricopeptide repeat protein [Casimicrobiaceae bacterium]
MHERSAVTTYLFTDIEGSTRLWETEPDKMRPALARHDAIVRACVEGNRGTVVKMSGDGAHAVFADPLDAVRATLELQRTLVELEPTTERVPLQVRCGMHAGVDERRDNDFFGSGVNRAARIMSVAHGGQVLLSQAVAALVGDRLPDGVSLRDLGSVRLRDLANPERVYQVVHLQLRQDFPALRSLEATPNNLPQQASSFVGRERELADIRNQLQNTRLLTLFGAGGIGKTRLSLQVAAEVLDDYPDGVWFADLAPMTDERLVPQAAASVLGVKEEAGRPVLEALMKYVSDRKLLLILDNCEHLLHACAELATQLLQSGPHLKILASSRQPLHVAGETTYHVPSLSVPEPQRAITIQVLTQYEAVRLFVDRARAMQPSFQITDSNSKAVVGICHRLDGIPLALELAAARVRALSVDEIAARLNDRFHLLTGGDRTALPRQQTLRASIDWSYELLTAHERTLLRRLAVFAGGWTLDAAEAVGAGGEVNTADVVDLLSQLVEQSLVAVTAGAERYGLLDTLRDYALEKLRASGEEEATRTRHLNSCVALAEAAGPQLVGPQQGAWLTRLDAERENILAAHAWCDYANDGAELGLRLVHSIKHYWVYRGQLSLSHRATVEALARRGAERRSLHRARGLLNAGQACCFMGRYSEAVGHLEQCLALARELGERGIISRALQILGMASLGQRESAIARQYLEEALDLARQLGNKRELAAAINGLAQLHRVEGALDAAEPLYEQVLGLAREVGDRESIAIALLNLAMVAIGRGLFERARENLLDVLAIVEEIGSKPAGQSVLEVCAGLEASLGNWERAARFYGMAEMQIRQTGLHRDPGDDAFLSPLILTARNAFGETAFAQAEDSGRACTYEQAIKEARQWLQGKS